MTSVLVKSMQDGRRRFAVDDRSRGLLRILAVFVAFVIIDRLVRAAAGLEASDSALLLSKSLLGNWVAVLVLVAGTTVLLVFRRADVGRGWTSFDHGDALRWIAIPWIVLTAWHGATYEYNYLAGNWHAVDRLLILVLAVAAIAHPLFLIPFSLQARVIAAQFVLPFGFTSAQNITNVVVMALVAISAVYVVVLITGDSDSSPVLIVISTMIASHMFLAGRAKIPLDWATTTELHQFAYSSFTAGWRGDGDGEWARSVASIMKPIRWPLIAGTMVLELGAAVAVVHRHLLRWWLVGSIAFHAAIFVVTGYFLLEFVIVELSLVVILTRSDLRTWVDRNDTIARGVLAAVIVVSIGPFLYQPPRLAWLDAPVSYGYEVEALGASGAQYHVALDDFAPFQQDLSFVRARFVTTPLVVGGYGATAGTAFYAQLQAVDSFEKLREIERSSPPIDDAWIARSEQVLIEWMDHVNRSVREPWFLVSPPSRYWTDRDHPKYRFEEPLQTVSVVLVRSIHDDGQRFQRETVLRVEIDPDGRPTIVQPGN